jgi:SH3-like domain-containing protein
LLLAKGLLFVFVLGTMIDRLANRGSAAMVLGQKRSVYAGVLGIMLCLGMVWLFRFEGAARVEAQDATPTPLPAVIVSRTPTPFIEITATPSRTPTPAFSTIRVQAKERANVRSAPSLDSTVYAEILPGEFFAVTGRYGKWIRIEFLRVPAGLGWVFEDVIEATGGDLATLPELDPNAVPTANIETAAVQQTAAAITGTPGAPGTATAAAAIATGVSTRVAEIPTLMPGEPLPTFTYPPPLQESTLAARGAGLSGSGLPPIVPIAVLAGLGVLGLLASLLRRR